MAKDISGLSKKIKTLFDQIFEIKDTETGEPIYPIFHVLPDKKIYTDYYDIIMAPTSLNTIKKRYTGYQTPNEFIKDIAQIVWNAKTYNEPGSFVYKYAEQLDAFIRDTVIPRFSKSGYDVAYPDITPITATRAGALTAYGQTVPSAAVSVSGTPSKLSTPAREDRSDKAYDHIDDETMTRRRTAAQSISSAVAANTTQSYNKDQSYKRGRPPVIDKPFEQRIKNVMRAIRKEKTPNGQFVSSPFERLPDMRDYPDYYNTISEPISLDEIRKKIKQRKYKDVQQFIDDMKLMFANAKYYNEKESLVFKQATILENVFQRTIDVELKRPDADYIPTDSLKIPLDQLELHGSLFKIGDWILINNPNDSTKPIVAQLFRIWQTQDGQRWINVCWYLRPEQTVHRVDRLFYENEVVKSGQYRDHLADEVVGKCYVAYFTRYQRGDPAVKIEGPLFICEFRYNDNDKNFNKIRTWKACLPDEVRDIEDPINPLPSLRRFKKYESPLKHLLPANATIDMPIPEPTIGAPNAPPLHGAVYVRGIDETDDLGQYSTSRMCPKYIIRPNDPPPTDSPAPTTPIVTYPRNSIHPNQQAQHQYQQQHNLAQTSTNLYHATPSYIPTSTASSFTIPIELPEKNNQGLLRMDKSNNRRRLTGITSDVPSQGPLIWFRSPGVNVTSRVAPSPHYLSFNKITNKRKRDGQDDGDLRDEVVTPPGNGLTGSLRLGHSAKYIAFKLAKLEKLKKDAEQSEIIKADEDSAVV
jgi:chromatin structure-remodeling complex subunit RSC1/2